MPSLRERLEMHEHYVPECPCSGCAAVHEAIAILAAAEAWAQQEWSYRALPTHNNERGRQLTLDALLALFPPPDAKEKG